MNSDDRLYYRMRAQTERARVEACTEAAAALSHRAMADEYERRAVDAVDMHDSANSAMPAIPGQAQ